MILAAGTVKRIHVDRRVVAFNRKNGTNKPALTIQTSRGPIKARWIKVIGEQKYMQADGKHLQPLSCGARIWVQTLAAVEYR